ncbi:MAG: hypothetical protein U0V87_05240 [Acidobacteriota bacterium]
MRRVGAIGLAAAAILASPLAAAQGVDSIDGYFELGASRVNVTTTPADQEAREAQFDSLLQRYSFGFNKRLWPNLRFRIGGFFERNDTQLEPEGFDTDSRRTRPYIGLTLRTPFYVADVSFDRNEQRIKPIDRETTKQIRETFNATLGWFPVGLPTWRLQYFHTNDYDSTRLLTDSSADLLQLTSQYSPIESLRLQYRGSLNERTDRLDQTDIHSVNHSARITYSDTFLDRRLAVNSNYEVSYRAARTEIAVDGEVRFPILLVADGLSSLDDIPTDGALASTPSLVDENLTVSSGIDLGFEPLSGDRRLRNFGIDFGGDTEVNTLQVTVDRELTLPDVADTFVWEVYTSIDNLRWVRRDVVTASNGANFDPIQRRFEIRFATVVTRYVKLVVAPLANDPRGLFPDIFVTELQAELRRNAADVRGSIRSTSHNYNLDVRTRILDTPSLHHEFSYLYNKPGPARARYLWSNGFSLAHAFNDIYSVSARIAREVGRQSDGSRAAYVYTAAVSAIPLPALRESLVFSGRDERIAGLQTKQNSVLLNTNAELYRGIDVNVGLGKGYTAVEGLPRVESTQINATATLAPNPKLTVNLSYQKSEDALAAGPTPRVRPQLVSAREINVAVRPLSTLYLFGSYRLERREGELERDINNYTLSWVPFPDGTLHFNFSYTESVRSEFDATERTVGPSLRWDISKRAFLDVAYFSQRLDSTPQRIDTEILSGTLRVAF